MDQEADSRTLREALDAAVGAFTAARSARMLLDVPGRLGADVVTRTRSIGGARRASTKAQAAMELAAHKLDEARDRWAALARGLAADLDMPPESLVELVEGHAYHISRQELLTILELWAASADTAAAPPGGPLRADVEQAVGALRRLAESESSTEAQEGGPSSG